MFENSQDFVIAIFVFLKDTQAETGTELIKNRSYQNICLRNMLYNIIC